MANMIIMLGDVPWYIELKSYVNQWINWYIIRKVKYVKHFIQRGKRGYSDYDIDRAAFFLEYTIANVLEELANRGITNECYKNLMSSDPRDRLCMPEQELRELAKLFRDYEISHWSCHELAEDFAEKAKPFLTNLHRLIPPDNK